MKAATTTTTTTTKNNNIMKSTKINLTSVAKEFVSIDKTMMLSVYDACQNAISIQGSKSVSELSQAIVDKQATILSKNTIEGYIGLVIALGTEFTKCQSIAQAKRLKKARKDDATMTQKKLVTEEKKAIAKKKLNGDTENQNEAPKKAEFTETQIASFKTTSLYKNLVSAQSKDENLKAKLNWFINNVL